MARLLHRQEPAAGKAGQGSTVLVKNDLVAISVNHEDWTGDTPAQFGRGLLTQNVTGGCNEHLWSRIQSPADRVLDRLRRMRLRERPTEKELEESPVVAQPVVGVVLHPVDVLLLLLIEQCRRCQPERIPRSKRHSRRDEDGGCDPLGMLSREQERPSCTRRE